MMSSTLALKFLVSRRVHPILYQIASPVVTKMRHTTLTVIFLEIRNVSD